MRVLIADKLPPAGVQAIVDLGLEVEVRPELGSTDLPTALGQTGAEILVVRSTKVTSEAFTAAPALGLVIRAGAGINTIDVAAANRHGVFVSNCPGKNAIAVAELTMGMILALDRRIPEANAELKNGRWNKKEYGQARGLHGRRLGLVGFGAIAREVAKRARAFGMVVEACSRSLTPDEAERHDVEVAPDLETMLKRCDVVSIHLPYHKDTHHLIGATQLAMMRPGAILIHAARAGIVDDAALAEVVAAGKIRAGLDVLEGEPNASDTPFASAICQLPGVYATPHIGASTDQAESATAAEVVRIIAEYLRSGTVQGAVNLDRETTAHFTVVIRHRDRVGVLAGVLGSLRAEHLNVQQMQNVVFDGHETACASIRLERRPSPDLLERLRAQDDVLSAEVRSVF